jgi:hypothetical protein
MSESNNYRSNINTKKKKNEIRVFESDSMALQSLRLIAAPKPEDDLTADQMVAYCEEKSFSSETIHNLINFVKSI